MEYTIAALEAGKHVMCEARMACNAAQARMMLETSLANPKLTAQVVPSPFTLKWDATICRLMAEGYLGKLLRVEARGVVGSTFPEPEGAALHWRHDKSLSGNNIMMMGIFYEALMRWVGQADSVMAMGSINVRERTRAESGEKVTVEIPDDIDIVARMCKDGAQAHLHFSTVCGMAERKISFWLYGSEGTIALEPTAQDETMHFRGGRRGESLESIAVPKEEEAMWRVEEEFIASVRGTEPIRLTSFVDGVKYMEFTDAVTESLTTGCMVKVGGV